MRRIASFVLALALVIPIGGCAGEIAKLQSAFQSAEAAVTSPLVGEVAPKAAIAAITAYDGLAIIATKWWKLPRCTGQNGPLCRDASYGDRVDAAVLSGRSARDNIKSFIRTHRGAAVPSTFYDAIIAANTTINEATATYRAALGN